MMKKILILFLFGFLSFTNNVKAQGVDVIFYLDNSGSISVTEYTGMVQTVKDIMDKVLLCNTYNRAAVVHFGTPTLNDRADSRIYIESDFTNNLTNLQDFQRHGGSETDLGISDFAALSLKVVENALDGVPDSHILSTQTVLTRNPLNKLVIFYFTDATRDEPGSKIIDPSTSTDPFEIYNTFKNVREATFVPLYTSAGSTLQDEKSIKALAAVASVGGDYTGLIDDNPGDPQGNQVSPRKLYIANNFAITTSQLDDLSDDICRSCKPVVAINALTPLTQTYCTDDSSSTIKKLMVDVTGTGVISYKWFKNTTNSNSGGVEIVGATSSEYIPPITQGSIYYYVEVTDSFCEGESKSVPVNVTVRECTLVTCNATLTNLPMNGTVMVNGINTTVVSSGRVTTFGNTHVSCIGASLRARSLFLGYGIDGSTISKVFSVKISFDKPVNNIVFLMSAIDKPETFTITSNGQPVTIYSGPGQNCDVEIDGNVIKGTVETHPDNIGGGGLFRISMPSNFTELTIAGPGGANGSLVGICDSSLIPATTCIKPSTAIGTSIPSKTGITIQEKREEWPQDIPNGWLTLESKTKGFAITRVANEAAIQDPKEGMLIYDISASCVKLYNGNIWGCLEKNCELPIN